MIQARHAPALGALISCFGLLAIPAQAVESIYPSLDLKACRKTSTAADSATWACPGAAGIRVHVAEGDARMVVSYGPSAERQLAAKAWFGPLNEAGKTIEWRAERRGAAPFAMILRWSLERIVAETVERLGRLDYLVNNAGISRTDRPIPPAELDVLTEDFWSDVLSVNLVGPFRATRAAAPHLKRTGGAVVNTASTAAFGFSGSSMVYAASKAGLVSLTRNLARALAPEVRVNAVAPGLIRTPWTARFGPDWEMRSVNMTMLKRAGTPEDVAEVMLFLCAGAGYVTGQTILVDGGLG